MLWVGCKLTYIISYVHGLNLLSALKFNTSLPLLTSHTWVVPVLYFRMSYGHFMWCSSWGSKTHKCLSFIFSKIASITTWFMVHGSHIISFNFPIMWWSSKWFKPLLSYRNIFYVMVYHCEILNLHSAMSMMMWCWCNFMLSFAYFLLYQMVMWTDSASTSISFSDSNYLMEWYHVDGVISCSISFTFCYINGHLITFLQAAISYTHTLTSCVK